MNKHDLIQAYYDRKEALSHQEKYVVEFFRQNREREFQAKEALYLLQDHCIRLNRSLKNCRDINSIAPRCSELAKQGFLQEIQPRVRKHLKDPLCGLMVWNTAIQYKLVPEDIFIRRKIEGDAQLRFL